jgi:glycosyltransferase involved in cell wall biosynthesis
MNLDHAANLARAVGCWLVVFCSRDARGTEVSDLLAAKRLQRTVVVDLPPFYNHHLLDFGTSTLARAALPERCANPNGDLSTKRNLGLILARMVGWDRIFFMDDDIRGLAPADLRRTTSMLDRYTCAGMRVAKFPDNSVVCHARRGAGDKQDVFVTGSVLAVDCSVQVNFFPEVYNEDWLFFYDLVREKRLGQSDCDARQLEYDPFDDVLRASGQEFGDVLAEGLYTLLHKGIGPDQAVREYWINFMVARRVLIEDIMERSRRAWPPATRKKVMSALRSALMCLMGIQPRVYENYVRTWRSDLKIWKKDLDDVRRVGSVEAGLRDLQLERAVKTEPARPSVAVRAVPVHTCEELPRRIPGEPVMSSSFAVFDLLLGGGMGRYADERHSAMRDPGSRRKT